MTWRDVTWRDVTRYDVIWYELRKNKDYVYGIWLYKVLGIRQGYYKVKKHAWNREPRQEIIIKIWNLTPSYQTYIPTLKLKCEPNSGLSCRRQVVHPRPQTPQGESIAKPETPLLIILSKACKYEVHGNLFSPLFEKTKSVDKNIFGRWLEIETAFQNKSIHNKERLSTSAMGQPVPEKGRPLQAIPSPIPHQQTHNYMLRPMWCDVMWCDVISCYMI